MAVTPSSRIVAAVLAAGLGAAAPATPAATPAGQDVDPLSLQSAEPAAEAPAGPRWFVEAALGRQERRFGLDAQATGRLSLDLRHRWQLGGGWSAALSDRLDAQDPASPGASERVLNSLREAYAGWSSPAGDTLVEFGRINLRQGPAYGFNPTDFFRGGALRNPTSPDPLALRENRLGTVMLRGQHAAGAHTLGWALAPRLDDTPGGGSFDLDLGSTNHSHRALLTVGSRWSERWSTQALLFHDRRRGTQIGASASALLGDAVVAYGEWAWGRDADLRTGVLRRDHRAAAGLTLALPAKVSLTVELARNGFGVDDAGAAAAAAAGPAGFGALLTGARVAQDPWGRDLLTLYLRQQDGLAPRIDLSVLLRRNLVDDSQLAWVELRRRWDGFDGAIQAQWLRGGAFTEYGASPVQSLVQAVLTVYF